MSQQFLHHFEFCPDTAQESRKSVPKRMPSESFLNSGLRGGGTNISPQDRLAPDRFPATVLSACKNPMVRFVVTADLPPFTERLQDDRMNWHRLLRRFGLTRADDTRRWSASRSSCFGQSRYRPTSDQTARSDVNQWKQQGAPTHAHAGPDH